MHLYRYQRFFLLLSQGKDLYSGTSLHRITTSAWWSPCECLRPGIPVKLPHFKLVLVNIAQLQNRSHINQDRPPLINEMKKLN